MAGLGDWRLRTDPDVDYPRDIARLRAHPRFGEAVRHNIASTLGFIDENPAYFRAFTDWGQYMLGMIALYLDATGGIRHRRLREMSSGLTLVSAGRATAALIQMRMAGYIRPETRSLSGRAQSYAVLPAMRDVFRRRMRIDIESAAILEPEAEALLARYDQPPVFPVLCDVSGQILLNSSRPVKSMGFEVMNVLIERRAGLMLMCALFLAADSGGRFPAHGPVDTNVARLSERLGVSRGQILAMLRVLEEAGYYKRESHGPDAITPAFREIFEVFFALMFVASLALANLTLLAVTGKAAAGERDRPVGEARS